MCRQLGREAVASAGWRRQPNDDSLALLNAHHLEELLEVEQRLATITTSPFSGTFELRACARRQTDGMARVTRGASNSAAPPARRITGPATEALLWRFLGR